MQKKQYQLKNKKEKIFFISHDSSQTGAPILLLRLIELLCKYDKYDIELLLVRGGVLENKFRLLLPVTTLKSHIYGKTRNIVRRVFEYLRYRIRLYKVINRTREFDLVFNNTIANGKILRQIKTKGTPVISYIHELDSVINEFNRFGEANRTIQFSDLVVCPSRAVADNLIKKYDLSSEKTDFLPYFISNDRANKISEEEKNTWLNRLGIPSGKFYVGGMGTATYRKGIDLFAEVCRKVVSIDQEICFVWIGDFVDAATKEKMEADANDLFKSNSFFLTGALPMNTANPGFLDIFFLSSREDPYPLVVLEAARMKIPTLYFKNTGGIQEFIEPDAGWGIDSIDTSLAAEKIVALKNNRNEINTRGNLAFLKLCRMHADENRVFSEFDRIVKKMLNNNVN